MKHLATCLIFILISEIHGKSKPCIQKEVSPGNIICVCNSTYCDELEAITLIPVNSALTFTSSQDGVRLNQNTVSIIPSAKIPENGTIIYVDASQTFQEIFGFGGAFTDSAGLNIASLGDKAQRNLLRAYFTENGLEYNIGRVPIASTDFSTRVYSYDDSKNDFELKNFNLSKEDLLYKIPYIISAFNLTKGSLELFASPWSAPGWMKETGKMQGYGSLIQDPKYFKAYVEYLKKFFEFYNNKGIPFWGMTVQNEPSTGSNKDWKWQTMNFTAESMRDFIKDYLGPTLQTSNVTKNLKVMILDDTRAILPMWADVIFSDEKASKYVHGSAIHWYWNKFIPAKFLEITHKRYPNKFILASEASAGFFPVSGPILGDWYRAESYAKDIINDLNNFVVAFCDWNLALDLSGGPNWAGNFVDSAIIIDKERQEFYKQPIYYVLAHFSKFFPRGSKIMATSIKGGNFGISAVSGVQNSRRRVVILNQRDLDYNVTIFDKVTSKQIPIFLPKRSIVSVVWDK
ncbi:hypothetical protein WR25_22915 [Diploscapter pachys]|uniref:Glucosylceramidase n=1 Tax=Diploscapter pachys TaxID=2018661 RepID=A0A2A2L2P6_9BILA|nr:hypothetical protein WR25_22915 [Diploscapter pachys]